MPDEPQTPGIEERSAGFDFGHLYGTLGGMVRAARSFVSDVAGALTVDPDRPRYIPAKPPHESHDLPSTGPTHLPPIKDPARGPITSGPVDLGGGRYDLLAEAEAARQGVDAALVKRVITRESTGRHAAVSGRGAAGLMQLMPGTAADLGVRDPADPAENIRGGVTYLKRLLARYDGDEATALAAYNWGPTNVDRARAAHGAGWLEHAPAKTRRYVTDVATPRDIPRSTRPDFTDLYGENGGQVTPSLGLEKATGIAAAAPGIVQHVKDFFTLPYDDYERKYPASPVTDRINGVLRRVVPLLSEAETAGAALEQTRAGRKVANFAREQLAHLALGTKLTEAAREKEAPAPDFSEIPGHVPH